jgi:hypothetical protein
VEAHDLLADEVQVGRPQIFAIRRPRSCSDERVEPDVEDVRRFAGHRNAPFDVGAGDGKIGEALPTKEITSLRRVSGWMKSGCARKARSSLSW